MRLIETLLFIANLLTFFAAVLPLPRTVFWMRHSVLIALLIAIAQVLVEGPRWQMSLLYMLTGLFFLIWLRNTTLAGEPTSEKRANWLVIGLGILALTLAVVLPITLPVFHFTTPSGPYEIGTMTYHWVDSARPEIFDTDRNARRELIVQIWYPAKKGSVSLVTSYIRDSDAVTTALARLLNIPDFSLQHLKYVTTNAAESVPVAEDIPNYPVILFLEGLTGYRQMNTFQVEELVSHGYVVVGIDQPGIAALVVFPDGHQIAGFSKAKMEPLTQQSISPIEIAPLLNGQAFKDGNIPYFAQDISFTLDQLESLNSADPNNILTKRLNLEHTGVFGMSFGGIVAAEACLKEPRLKACLIMDAVMTADVVAQGLQQPSLWITRDADTMRLERERSGGWTDKDIEQTQTTMRAVYNRLPGDGYFVQVPGMFHIDLTDVTYISPLFPQIGLSGPIGRQRAHEIINTYSLAFFDRHLNGRPATLLDGPADHYPDVLLETRQP